MDIYLNEYSFEEYCEDCENGIACVKGKNVFSLQTSKQTSKKLASICPQIDKVRLTEIIGNKKYFEVKLDLPLKITNGEEVWCEVCLASQRITDFREVESFLIQSGLVYNKKSYINLCKRYFNCVLSTADKVFYTNKIGWKAHGNKKIFTPLFCSSYYSETMNIFSYWIFNKDNLLDFSSRRHDSRFREKSKEEVLTMSDSFQTVFACLSNKQIMGIFGYTVYALSLYYLLSTDTMKNLAKEIPLETLFFSICITGDDMKSIKIIANLFSNLAYSDMQKRCTELGSQFRFSATSLDTNEKRLKEVDSVPFIITSKTQLNRNSSICKTMHRKRIKGEYRIFPVYLNLKPLNADEIFDFNISSAMNCLPPIDQWQDLKDEIALLLLLYIKYLSDISEQSRSKERYRLDQILISNYNSYYTNSSIEKQFLNTIWFYTALDIFCFFLQDDLKLEREAISLRKIARDYFITRTALDERKDVMSIKRTAKVNNTIILNSFWHYLKKLFKMTDEDRPYLHWKATDKTAKTECYYLSFSAFYEDFRKKQKIAMTETAFKNLLKQEGLLVLRSNAKQASVLRKHVDKKETVLAINIEAYENYIKSCAD